MTSYELNQEIERLLQKFPYTDPMLELLRHLSRNHDEIVEASVLLIAKQTESMPPSPEREAIFKLIEHHGDTLRNIKPRKVFTWLDEVEFLSRNLPGLVDSNDINNFQVINEDLKSFERAYELFLEGHKLINTYRIVSAAKILSSGLDTILDTLRTIRRAIVEAEPKDVKENEIALSMFLRSNNHLTIFVAKLQSLERIYAELCRLLNVSTSEYPLRIIKVESGSLWLKVFGESKVIILLTDFIRAGVQYLYRTYTREGQLSSIPRRVDELGALLNLEVRMRELGYDTTDMSENNQLSGAMIAKELNTLLAGETFVVLNEQTYSLDSTVGKRIAEKSMTLLLEEGNNSKGGGDE